MESRNAKLRSRWPEALILLQSVIYGFGDPISKIAMEVTPVYTMMTVRYTMAFLVCFLLFGKRIRETVKAVPVRAWLIPGMCIGLSYLLNNVALSITDATSVAFLRSFSKSYLEMVDPISMTALQAACSAVLAFAGSLLFEGGIHLETTTGIAWLIIVYLAVLCTFLGYLMQNLALTRIDGRTVSLIQCICPVMTAVFSFFMLGEHLSVAGMAGAIIIIGCITAGAVIPEDTDRIS